MRLMREGGRQLRLVMIALAGCLALQGCALIESAHYDVRDDAVYWVSYPGSSSSPSFGRYDRRLEADPQSFEILAFANWGKDAQTAYYRGMAIAGADAASFHAISDEIAADTAQVWAGTALIAGADGASFRLISGSYGVDRTAAYGGWTRFEPCDLATFAVMGDEDEGFTADSACVYSYGLRLPLHDRASFELLGGGYSRDSGGVYWRQFELDGADPASFHIPPGILVGRDRTGCWLGPDRRDCRD